MNPRLVIVVKRRGKGDDDLELFSGPEVSVSETEKRFMAFRLKNTHADFEFAALCRLNVERQERLQPEPQSTSTKSTKPSKSDELDEPDEPTKSHHLKHHAHKTK